jgi:hypothetical protein
MSNKITPTRGLHRVDRRDRELTIATKVTGRNLASVSYIISLEAERRGVSLELRTKFAADGSLDFIHVYEQGQPVGFLISGHYLILEPGAVEAQQVTPQQYERLYQRVD